jgi:hypothetical protein
LLADGEADWRDRLLAEAGAERVAQSLRICRLCVEMLAVTGAGIAMVTATGHRGVVCATDDVSAGLEELQLTLGEGPCADAVTVNRPCCRKDDSAYSAVTSERDPSTIDI